jgi:hypothetical protein
VTAREHAERGGSLAEAAWQLRRSAHEAARGGFTEQRDEMRAEAERQQAAALTHATVALALAATDVTSGKATVKRRLV